jgi:hypothetical protein
MMASPFFPESLAPIRRYEGTAHGMLDILVARFVLTAQRKQNGLTPVGFARLGLPGELARFIASWRIARAALARQPS